MIQVPDSRNGWGTISLRDAFRGPGQLLGRFTVNTQGFSDVWSNNISDVAIKARQQEDAAEDALWQSSQVTNACVLSLPPGSTLAQTDFAAGQARAAARATRIYTGQLVKQGDGTLFLTGANTYTGQTTASGGKLSITGSLTSPLAVSGGTLGGSGTLTGTVSALGGIVWPGLSPDEAAFINDGVTTAGDTLTVTSIKIGPAAAFATTIRSQSDYTQLRTTGLTVVGGTLMIDLQRDLPTGSVLAIVAGSSPIIGTFKNLPEGSILTASSGLSFRISYLNNSVTLTVLSGASHLRNAGLGTGRRRRGAPVVERMKVRAYVVAPRGVAVVPVAVSRSLDCGKPKRHFNEQLQELHSRGRGSWVDEPVLRDAACRPADDDFRLQQGCLHRHTHDQFHRRDDHPRGSGS